MSIFLSDERCCDQSLSHCAYVFAHDYGGCVEVGLTTTGELHRRFWERWFRRNAVFVHSFHGGGIADPDDNCFRIFDVRHLGLRGESRSSQLEVPVDPSGAERVRQERLGHEPVVFLEPQGLPVVQQRHRVVVTADRLQRPADLAHR